METKCPFCGAIGFGNRCLSCGMNKDAFALPEPAKKLEVTKPKGRK
jgi:hypothetical protein